MLYNIYFSPTGGTKKVSDILSSEFNNVTNIDLTKRDTDYSAIAFNDDDIVIVSVPSFSGRVPEITTQRLLQLKGNNAKAILVVVYGNREFDDTLIELNDTLTLSNFVCVAGVTALAKHSIVTTIASDRPNANDKKVLTEYIKTIHNKITQAECLALTNLPGNRPYKQHNKSSLTPIVTDICDACGICEKICPVGAINGKTTDINVCFSCMACINACPKSARILDKATYNVVSEKLHKICVTEKENQLFI